ncbi:hypothetical protein PVAG01_07062 [Phlyctema vagabunda]|uniref:Uncharacterized protein n=1 Tax=Phlyctema vagabunda TaxID=108571 RepID=A0ABR4PBC6_9HELO
MEMGWFPSCILQIADCSYYCHLVHTTTTTTTTGLRLLRRQSQVAQGLCWSAAAAPLWLLNPVPGPRPRLPLKLMEWKCVDPILFWFVTSNVETVRD